MLRQRDTARIRADAVRMGVQKAKNGCLSCSEQYFELARQHGATEEEIRGALESATGTTGKRLSRRNLVKLAAVGAAGGLALETTRLFGGKAQAVSTWWG